MSSFTYKDLELCLPEVEVIYTAVGGTPNRRPTREDDGRGEGMSIKVHDVYAPARTKFKYDRKMSILPLLTNEQEDLIKEAIEEHETDSPEEAEYKRATMRDPNSDRWA